ncbi:unnamed protein product, partial [Ixodes hexagonus]
EEQFLDTVFKEVHKFASGDVQNSLLLFPALLKRERFLTHKVVEENFESFCSFSLGENDLRRTAICLKSRLIQALTSRQCNHEGVHRLALTLCRQQGLPVDFLSYRMKKAATNKTEADIVQPPRPARSWARAAKSEHWNCRPRSVVTVDGQPKQAIQISTKVLATVSAVMSGTGVASGHLVQRHQCSREMTTYDSRPAQLAKYPQPSKNEEKKRLDGNHSPPNPERRSERCRSSRTDHFTTDGAADAADTGRLRPCLVPRNRTRQPEHGCLRLCRVYFTTGQCPVLSVLMVAMDPLQKSREPVHDSRKESWEPSVQCSHDWLRLSISLVEHESQPNADAALVSNQYAALLVLRLLENSILRLSVCLDGVERQRSVLALSRTSSSAIVSGAVAAPSTSPFSPSAIGSKRRSGAGEISYFETGLCAEFLQPFKPRPQTSASVARRLVSGALGLRVQVEPEQRKRELQVLREAKG